MGLVGKTDDGERLGETEVHVAREVDRLEVERRGKEAPKERDEWQSM